MNYEKLKKSVQQRLDRRMSESLTEQQERHKHLNENASSDIELLSVRPEEKKVALCITVPKTVSWSDYERELADVADGMMEMNYKLSSMPKRISVGDRCYVVHNGMIRGWMTITGIDQREESFKCQTTGRIWNAGVYIRRSGPFHYLERPIPMKGFMGYKYIPEID